MDLQILGRLVVRSAEGRALTLTPLARRALCVLALHTHAPLQAEQFDELLWEAGGEKRSRQVKTLVAEIRRALTVDRVPHGHEGYRLRLLPGDTVDLLEFRDDIKRAHTALGRGDDQEAADCFRRALARWPDPPLPDLPTTTAMSWVVESLLSERRSAREESATMELRLGRHRPLIPLLTEWTTQDPLNELLWARLLLALYRDGRKAEALRRWDVLRTTMEHEVGAAPGAALTALRKRIINDDPELTDGIAAPSTLGRSRPPAGGARVDAWWAGDLPSSPTRIDVTAPNVARIYDFFLSGKNNFAADREAARQIIEALPQAPIGARESRALLGRMVRFLATEAGIDQFLDIGCGLPTRQNVHEVALSARPDAHVLYVDNDPVVLSHARAILAAEPRTAVIEADLCDPDSILHNPHLPGTIDLNRPVAVLLLSVLHCVPDHAQVVKIVRRFRDAVAPGSYIAISHITRPVTRPGDLEGAERGALVYTEMRANTSMTFRRPDQIAELFDGLELLEPGLVDLPDWRPDPAHITAIGGSKPSPTVYLCGIARKDRP